MTRPVPYPADVRAKGWRFEVDYEKVEQSDTWDLATEVPMAQPALLMMWMMAWTQVPCGSMPNDENLIRVKCRIPPKAWPALKPILMRGWWLADDGRLYHDTIVLRVQEMLEYRRKNAERVAKHSAKTKQSRATNALATGDNHGSNDTGTGTGTFHDETTTTSGSTSGSVGGDRQSPTKAGEVCRAIRAKGIAGVNPSDPELLAFIEKGVAIETFEAAADLCIKAKPPKGVAYLLGIVRRQLGEAAAIASGPGVPDKPWDIDRPSIEAKAAELGINPWNERDLRVDRETFPQFTERVRRAVNERQGVPA